MLRRPSSSPSRHSFFAPNGTGRIKCLPPTAHIRLIPDLQSHAGTVGKEVRMMKHRFGPFGAKQAAHASEIGILTLAWIDHTVNLIAGADNGCPIKEIITDEGRQAWADGEAQAAAELGDEAQ